MWKLTLYKEDLNVEPEVIYFDDCELSDWIAFLPEQSRIVKGTDYLLYLDGRQTAIFRKCEPGCCYHE